MANPWSQRKLADAEKAVADLHKARHYSSHDKELLELKIKIAKSVMELHNKIGLNIFEYTDNGKIIDELLIIYLNATVTIFLRTANFLGISLEGAKALISKAWDDSITPQE